MCIRDRYNALSGEVRAAISDLAALKFEVLQKVGEAVGNIQTYQPVSYTHLHSKSLKGAVARSIIYIVGSQEMLY